MSVRSSKRSPKAIVEVPYGDSMIGSEDLWRLAQEIRPDLGSKDLSVPIHRDRRDNHRRVNSFKNVTGTGSLTHLRMLPGGR